MITNESFKIGLSDSDKTTMANQITAETLNKLIPAFSTSVAYTKGQYTMYSNALYRFTADKSAGEWDSTKVESATLDDLIDDVNNAVASVENKASVDGYYSTMGVGHADSALSLDTNVGNDDQTPFNYQTAGGTSDITTGIQSLKKLVGASVVMNQLVVNGNFANLNNWSQNGVTASVNNNIVSILASSQYAALVQNVAFISGHKYLMCANFKLTTATNYVQFHCNDNVNSFNKNCSETTDWQILSLIFQATNTGNGTIQLRDNRSSDWDTYQVKNVMLIDLTQMFGSQVADYIYAKEQANAGAGVAIFKSMFPNDYYAYNTGTFIHSKSAKIKMVDYNQWDEEWEVGEINGTTGANANTGSYIRSKNYINAIPNTQYYCKTTQNVFIYEYDSNKNYIRAIFTATNNTFTTSSNCAFIRFATTNGGTTYNHDICISLYWDGSRIGYEPYQEHIYDLPNDELKGVLKVVDNKIVADGDEEYHNEIKKTRYYLINLDDYQDYLLYQTDIACWRLENQLANVPYGKYVGPYEYPNMLSAGRTITYYYDGQKNVNGKMSIDAIGRLLFGTGSTTDKPTGQVLYELAEPTETTSTAFAENIYADDFGTMEFIDENNERITGIQGNEIFYKANISGFAESLYVKTDGDVDELVTQEDIDDTALATRGYIKLASITGYDATKTQVLKNVNGTFTWVDET